MNDLGVKHIVGLCTSSWSYSRTNELLKKQTTEVTDSFVVLPVAVQTIVSSRLTALKIHVNWLITRHFVWPSVKWQFCWISTMQKQMVPVHGSPGCGKMRVETSSVGLWFSKWVHTDAKESNFASLTQHAYAERTSIATCSGRQLSYGSANATSQIKIIFRIEAMWSHSLGGISMKIVSWSVP